MVAAGASNPFQVKCWDAATENAVAVVSSCYCILAARIWIGAMFGKHRLMQSMDVSSCIEVLPPEPCVVTSLVRH